MAFTTHPLDFPSLFFTRVTRTITNPRAAEVLSTYEFFSSVARDWWDIFICGPRGTGKTSLLNELAFRVNAEREDMLALGPLSLSDFVTHGGGSYSLRHPLYWSLLKLKSHFPGRLGLPRFADTPDNFKSLTRFIKSLVPRRGRRPAPRILILLDDLDGVPDEARASILHDLGDSVRKVYAGAFLDDEVEPVPGLDLRDTGVYTLGTFDAREMEYFFAQAEGFPGIIINSEARGEIALLSRSVPYFVQALLGHVNLRLSAALIHAPEQQTAPPPAPGPTLVTAELVREAARQMPSGVCMEFARPLTQLHGEERAVARRLLDRLRHAPSVRADWELPVVRRLARWGLVRRERRNRIDWAAPLLRDWYRENGTYVWMVGWGGAAVALEPPNTEQRMARDLEVIERAEPMLRRAEEHGDQLGAARILYAMTGYAGGDELALGWLEAPSVLKVGALIREHPSTFFEQGSFVGPAPALFPRLDPRLMPTLSLFPPASVESEKPRAVERYINVWFTVDRDDRTRIPKSHTLVRARRVYLRVNIAPFDRRTILKGARAFLSQEEIERIFPETKGRPVALDVSVFTRDFDLDGKATQKLRLVRGKPTRTLYFAVTPRGVPLSRLRVCVFYKNHLLQSLGVTAHVARRQQAKRGGAQRARVEMTFSADFSRAEKMPARGLWLGINQAADGTHTLNLKDSEAALSRNLADKVEGALKSARQGLVKVSFNMVKDEDTDQMKKVYRFDKNNFPTNTASDEGRKNRLKADLAVLAGAGRQLYEAVFSYVPLAERRDEDLEVRDQLEKTLRGEQVIQVARLRSMDDIWPWALMYDDEIDADRVRDVCLAFRGKDGALPYAEGVKRCAHRDPRTRENTDDRIVCPYSFWGFKHVIEQPTQPGGKKAFENLVIDLKLGPSPVMRMLLENSLGKQEEPHIKAMRDLKFESLSSMKEINSAFDPGARPPPPEPHVIYFFVHGKYDSHESPYLLVGTDERLRPSQLRKLVQLEKSHGLVFINGCHTVELEPKALSSIMEPFVNASASGIIGTEISVATYLARDVAQGFFKRFLAGGAQADPRRRKVGQIIKEIRLELLMNYNPLGLVYTPYCSADLHVVN